MTRQLIAALFVAPFVTAPAVAAAEERLVQPPQAGFVVAYSAGDERQTIEESVPRGESVKRWTRKITTQRLVGFVKKGIAANDLLARAAQGWETSCAGVRVTMPTATELRADCNVNGRTDLPKTVIMRIFTGTSDLYNVQVAFRRVPTTADLLWAQAHLAGATLCGAGADAATCGPANPVR